MAPLAPLLVKLLLVPAESQARPAWRGPMSSSRPAAPERGPARTQRAGVARLLPQRRHDPDAARPERCSPLSGACRCEPKAHAAGREQQITHVETPCPMHEAHTAARACRAGCPQPHPSWWHCSTLSVSNSAQPFVRYASRTCGGQRTAGAGCDKGEWAPKKGHQQ